MSVLLPSSQGGSCRLVLLAGVLFNVMMLCLGIFAIMAPCANGFSLFDNFLGLHSAASKSSHAGRGGLLGNFFGREDEVHKKRGGPFIPFNSDYESIAIAFTAALCGALMGCLAISSLASFRERLRKVTRTYWKGHAALIWRLPSAINNNNGKNEKECSDEAAAVLSSNEALLGLAIRGIVASISSSEMLLWCSHPGSSGLGRSFTNIFLDLLGILGFPRPHPSSKPKMNFLKLSPGDFGTHVTIESSFTGIFTSAAPRVFARIRQAYGVPESVYLASIATLNLNDRGPRLLTESEGKSGSFFVRTRDGHFIIKTISSSEKDTLMRLLPHYAVYLLEHPNTLLPWFLGMYEAKTGKHGTIRIIVMANVCSSTAADGLYVQELFDLKGSKVGRTASSSMHHRVSSSQSSPSASRTAGKTQASEQRVNEKRCDNSIVAGDADFNFEGEQQQRRAVCQKDLDWEALGRSVNISHADRLGLLQQLELDSAFLAKHNIMDYSLLVGISYSCGKKAARDPSMKSRAQTENDAPPKPSTTTGLARDTYDLFRRIPERECDRARAKSSANSPALHVRVAQMLRGAASAAVAIFEWRGAKHAFKTSSRFKQCRGGVAAHRDCLGDWFSWALPRSIWGTADATPVVYYVGIIDVLQEYNMKKRLESTVKGITLGGRSGISAVGPYFYAERFRAFMRKSVFHAPSASEVLKVE